MNTQPTLEGSDETLRISLSATVTPWRRNAAEGWGLAYLGPRRLYHSAAYLSSAWCRHKTIQRDCRHLFNDALLNVEKKKIRDSLSCDDGWINGRFLPTKFYGVLSHRDLKSYNVSTTHPSLSNSCFWRC